MSRAPLNADGRREISIEVRAITLSNKTIVTESIQLGELVLIAEDTDEPVRNDPDVCAHVVMGISHVIQSVMPIPSCGRIEFRALGNVVRFCSDEEPTETELINMTMNLLRETAEVHP
jgi:hypothetical protein